MDILPYLWGVFEKESEKIPSNDLILKGLWSIDLAFKPNPQERLFKYNVLVSLTKDHGCCYSAENMKLRKVDEFIGKHILDFNVDELRRDLSIAILDSGFSCLKNNSSERIILTGSPNIKGKIRGKIICEEIKKILGKDHIKIGLLGSAGSIIKEISERDWSCRATDMCPDIVGKKQSGIIVENYLNNSEILEESDAVIVTGMAISTNTLGNIINEKNRKKKVMLVYAETGSNFASEYIKLGVDVVVAEPFPFYIFNLPSKLLIYRKGDTFKAQ